MNSLFLTHFQQEMRTIIFDPEAHLREIEYLLNQDLSTDSSPTTDIDIIDPILERFTDEPALVYSFPPGDEDDDLFDFKSDNEEWKKLFDSTLPEESSESSEIATLLSSSFGNKDKVFNPSILILGGTQIFHDKSKDKDLKVNSSTKALLILVENNFLSHSSDRSSDRKLLFFLESNVIETLLSFSSESEDKVFNPVDFAILSFDHFLEIPSDESKVHIEVLLVLWINRLPIPDGSLPLSSRLKGGSNNNNNNPRLIKVCCFLSVRSRCLSVQKGQGIPRGRNKTTVSGRFAPDVAVV
ncbi:hypothetical protein Tco_1523922 [Tanacetum coccineum]